MFVIGPEQLQQQAAAIVGITPAVQQHENIHA
jgi:hypothetical protein